MRYCLVFVLAVLVWVLIGSTPLYKTVSTSFGGNLTKTSVGLTIEICGSLEICEGGGECTLREVVDCTAVLGEGWIVDSLLVHTGKQIVTKCENNQRYTACNKIIERKGIVYKQTKFGPSVSGLYYPESWFQVERKRERSCGCPGTCAVMESVFVFGIGVLIVGLIGDMESHNFTDLVEIVGYIFVFIGWVLTLVEYVACGGGTTTFTMWGILYTIAMAVGTSRGIYLGFSLFVKENFKSTLYTRLTQL